MVGMGQFTMDQKETVKISATRNEERKLVLFDTHRAFLKARQKHRITNITGMSEEGLVLIGREI